MNAVLRMSWNVEHESEAHEEKCIYTSPMQMLSVLG